MFSLTYTSYAVAGGAGGLGKLITAELVRLGAKVTVLTRTPGKAIAGAAERTVDYENVDAVAQTLKDIEADVVVSALSGPGLFVQPALADAAKKAGVKLFVPS